MEQSFIFDFLKTEEVVLVVRA